MGNICIGGTFSVNTVEDGQSAPYYFQEWFAWSNVVSTANVTTSPFAEPYSGWQTSIPNQGNLAYLWRKSIRFVWNENTRQYNAENAQYFRMSGADGTSISVKGTILDVVYTDSEAEAISRTWQNGDKFIYNSGMAWLLYTNVNGSPVSSSLSDGDAYTSKEDGHLYMYSAESSSVIDLGEFKGESGKTYYTHIVWATNIIYTGSVVQSIVGYTPTKTADDTTHIWMGSYVDENPSDPTSGSDTILKQYSWSNIKGDKGDSAQFIYLKGTARNSDNSGTEETCIVSITGGNNVSQNARGLNLVTINRQTLSVTSSINYDTWAQASGESGAYGITNLINKLNSLSSNVFVCLVSHDAIGWNDALIEKLQTFGMSDLPYTSAHRYPFLFIGYSGLGKGNGITRMFNAATPSVPVELSVYIANGALSVKDGERGKVGRFFYYAGVWENISSSTSFVVNDAQAPYFEHTVEGQKRYHVYNPSTNPANNSVTKSTMAETDFSNKPWESMTNDFKYIITEAIFGEFAHFGSAIISGDWEISALGKLYDTSGNEYIITSSNTVVINGVSYNKDNAYTTFDTSYPNSSKPNAVNFVPSYCVDLFTGAIYQQNAEMKGVIKATRFYNETKWFSINEGSYNTTYNYGFVPVRYYDDMGDLHTFNSFDNSTEMVSLYYINYGNARGEYDFWLPSPDTHSGLEVEIYAPMKMSFYFEIVLRASYGLPAASEPASPFVDIYGKSILGLVLPKRSQNDEPSYSDDSIIRYGEMAHIRLKAMKVKAGDHNQWVILEMSKDIKLL